MDEFFAWNGGKRNINIRLVAMDMWKAFRNSTEANAPNAAILYDKFHVMQKLSDALDQVRKSEYKRLPEKDRKFIKGQKYILLRNKENLNQKGRQSLKLLLHANQRLQKAYILKESFDQLWTYKSETWARKFFENWRDALKWQRLKPYEEFAKMVDRHWDGIISHLRAFREFM